MEACIGSMKDGERGEKGTCRKVKTKLMVPEKLASGVSVYSSQELSFISLSSNPIDKLVSTIIIRYFCSEKLFWLWEGVYQMSRSQHVVFSFLHPIILCQVLCLDPSLCCSDSSSRVLEPASHRLCHLAFVFNFPL